MSELRLFGIPNDGSTPFVMAHVGSIERAEEIFADTFRHYTQALSGWEVRDRNNQVLERRAALIRS